jgi:hypothetical protein
MERSVLIYAGVFLIIVVVVVEVLIASFARQRQSGFGRNEHFDHEAPLKHRGSR